MYYLDPVTGHRSYTLRKQHSITPTTDRSAENDLSASSQNNNSNSNGTSGNSCGVFATMSAHPARFSPDDKFSRHRVTIKKRFGILPTQQPPVVL